MSTIAPNQLKDAIGLKRQTLDFDLVVVGGGLSGMAAAVTAAREGLRVAIVQERPVFGGNASKEIRVPPQGASGGYNAAYFRETGLVEEMLLANLYNNPHGNPEGWHLVLTDAVLSQGGLTPFLNTVVTEVETQEGRMTSVTGYTLSAETWTTFRAPYFVDATGDGTVGALAGAKWRSGREARSEFGEAMAPTEAEPYTMGGTIMFCVRDMGHPVTFTRPKWAHQFTEKDLEGIPHDVSPNHRVSWIEWGGELDTIADNEEAKYELWRIVYGIWDHLKNDPAHREKTSTLDLEWVAAIPGKRESRRLIGPYILTANDVLAQTEFPDAVAYGGWYIDDHASKGFYHRGERLTNIHPPGLYGIPLRCLYSVNVPNLFFCGRNASLSHMALGSTRVMFTCAQMGEAVGMAAAVCRTKGLDPGNLSPEHVREIQQRLLRIDHYIPGVRNDDPADLARIARVSASSAHPSAVEPESHDVEKGSAEALDQGRLVMFPVSTGELDSVELLVSSPGEAVVEAKLWEGDKKGNFFPVRFLAASVGKVRGGAPEWVRFEFKVKGLRRGWHFLEIAGAGCTLHCSRHKLVGMRLYRPHPKRWIKSNQKQDENPYAAWKRVEDVGAPFIRIVPDQAVYGPEQAVNGYARPTTQPNIWISARTDFSRPEYLTLAWDAPQRIGTITVAFDTDLDRTINTMWARHAFNVMEPCARRYRIEAQTTEAQPGDGWRTLAEESDNFQRFCKHTFKPLLVKQVRISILETWGTPFASIYEVRVYE